MEIFNRWRDGISAAAKHLLISFLIAGVVATLVFILWYPRPYHLLAGGLTLLLIVVAVDVVIGPLLTLVVFDRKKPRKELTKDLFVIALLQLAGLAYGVYSLAQARPVFLAYEGNRYRVVSMADLDAERLKAAPQHLQSPSYTGPKLLGVKLVSVNDSGLKDSVLLSMQGLHPSFRPERWVSYESVLPELQKSLLSIETLKAKHPDAVGEIDALLNRHQLKSDEVGYLPVDAEKADPKDWVALVGINSGKVLGYLALDGW